MSLELRIRKRLSPTFALEVEISKGDGFLGILGASGSGKSMTLKCIAGIETPDEGYIAVSGRVLYDSAARVNLRPQQRRVGYLFQDYALFPTMTVAQNIACGLRGTGESPESLLRRFGLAGLEGRYPHMLSGGQQQRVALARMLASAPEVILLDEPFSALDEHLREQVQMQTADALRGHRDVILVTHNRSEAYKLCDTLVLLDGGRTAATGETRALFQNPRTVWAARLTGCKNISPIRPVDEHRVEAVDWGVTLRTAAPVGPATTHIGIRAHDFTPCDAPGENTFPVRVESRWEDVFEWNLLCAPTRGQVWWKVSKYQFSGDPPYLAVPPEAIFPLTDGM